MIMTSTSRENPAVEHVADQLRLVDLTEFRAWLDREERDGATVVRIERLREFFGLVNKP